MEQVHLYRAGTNGRPVQQSYTLTGSASIGFPKGKHQGKGPEPALKTLPPPPTHHSREGPGKAPGEHRPKRRGKEKEGEGHAKGAAGRHTTTNRPQPGEAGNHTRTPQQKRERGRDTQPPQPHRAAKPSPERQGQAPKEPLTHRTHAHGCTQHTPPQLPPTRAPHTYDFSSCFFPKFKKSAKGRFSREMTYFFDFYGPKIGGGGLLLPGSCPKISKTLKFGLFWGIFACSGLVLQNSAAHQCTCL